MTGSVLGIQLCDANVEAVSGVEQPAATDIQHRAGRLHTVPPTTPSPDPLLPADVRPHHSGVCHPGSEGQRVVGELEDHRPGRRVSNGTMRASCEEMGEGCDASSTPTRCRRAVAPDAPRWTWAALVCPILVRGKHTPKKRFSRRKKTFLSFHAEKPFFTQKNRFRTFFGSSGHGTNDNEDTGERRRCVSPRSSRGSTARVARRTPWIHGACRTLHAAHRTRRPAPLSFLHPELAAKRHVGCMVEDKRTCGAARCGAMRRGGERCGAAPCGAVRRGGRDVLSTPRPEHMFCTQHPEKRRISGHP